MKCEHYLYMYIIEHDAIINILISLAKDETNKSIPN